MEQRNNLVLQGTETFSRGQLDNVALESGSIVLDSAAGRYLQYGSYTTPEFAMPAFCNLNVSWNAHAPHNTMVEVRCRVYAGNAWTGWMRASSSVWPGLPTNRSSSSTKATTILKALTASSTREPSVWLQKSSRVPST